MDLNRTCIQGQIQDIRFDLFQQLAVILRPQIIEPATINNGSLQRMEEQHDTKARTILSLRDFLVSKFKQALNLSILKNINDLLMMSSCQNAEKISILNFLIEKGVYVQDNVSRNLFGQEDLEQINQNQMINVRSRLTTENIKLEKNISKLKHDEIVVRDQIKIHIRQLLSYLQEKPEILRQRVVENNFEKLNISQIIQQNFGSSEQSRMESYHFKSEDHSNRKFNQEIQEQDRKMIEKINYQSNESVQVSPQIEKSSKENRQVNSAQIIQQSVVNVIFSQNNEGNRQQSENSIIQVLKSEQSQPKSEQDSFLYLMNIRNKKFYEKCDRVLQMGMDQLTLMIQNQRSNKHNLRLKSKSEHKDKKRFD